MQNPASPSALREWRTHLGRPQVLFGCLGVGTILGLVGPFDTGEVLGLVPRLIYWIAVAGLSYATGALVGIVLFPRLPAALPNWARLALASCATGLGVFAFITLGNWLIFGLAPDMAEIPATLTLFIVISGLVTFLLELLPDGDAPEETPPRLLDRLPIDKRGPLLSLSVEDHYVRVRTTNGEEMVLMRFSDAMAEVGSTAGLQVHRSHWVALDAVTAATRRGDGAMLTLSNGDDIPVSRSNMAAVKAAGLLPR